MNRKHEKIEKGEQMNDEYVVRRSRLSDVIAIIVCIALALTVWVMVMNTEDSDHVFTKVLEPASPYTYELSLEHLEVKGSVSALRHATWIGVRIPEEAVAPGVYQLTEADLIIPQGVRLAEPLNMTLTVSEK